MNNRIPWFILGTLVFLALVWRIVNPPPPLLPGPLGQIPHWSSMTKLGDMGPDAVNPAGELWAGAWNQKDKQGVTRSAVVIIELEKRTFQHVGLGEGFTAASLFWRDNGHFSMLLTDSADPALVTRSRLVNCTVGETATKCENVTLPTDVASILAWPQGSDKFVARLAGNPVKTAIVDGAGKLAGKEIVANVPEDAKFYHIAALSPDGGSYVFAVDKSQVGGLLTFCLADAKTGTVKELFTSKDVPGIVEGMWVSPAGVLIVASERGKLHVVKFDPATAKMSEVTGKNAIDVAKSWPGAPARMLLTKHDGGYQLDLATGAIKKIVSFDTSNRMTVYWRTEVQGGRLYPRKDGDYTSVSHSADMVDIRVVKKDGSDALPILRRR